MYNFPARAKVLETVVDEEPGKAYTVNVTDEDVVFYIRRPFFIAESVNKADGKSQAGEKVRRLA